MTLNEMIKIFILKTCKTMQYKYYFFINNVLEILLYFQASNLLTIF